MKIEKKSLLPHLIRGLLCSLICILFLFNTLRAQDRLILVDSIGRELKIGFKISRIQTDSLGLTILSNKLSAHFMDEGYLEARILGFKKQENLVEVSIDLGPVYTWGSIALHDDLNELPGSIGIKSHSVMGSKISPSAIRQINKRILAHYENNGYPFAAVFYSNLKIEGDKVSGILQVEKGPLITMDTVSISGDCKLSKRYLQSYLSISPGEPYDERIVRRVPDRIKELPMVTEIRPFSVGFSNDKSVAFLYLKDKKASQADGVIGVQPPAKTDVDAKTRVTADLRIRLLSAFGRGELLDFNWRQPSPLTQDLKARFSYPFLFDSPFGVDAGIAIYKKDTTYLDVELDGGLQFLLDGGNFLKVFFKNKKSSLISTARYKNTTVLPPFADISKSLYGVGLRKFSLDYRLNPRKGYSVELSASAGNRKIEINTDLPKALYDSLDLQTLQFSSELNGNIYLPIASRLVAAVGCRSGWIFGGDLFENELTRLGGMSTIRGFDEESIKASSFVIGRFEMRYILERNSNFYLFLDQGWLERGSGPSYFRDTPYGFGAGISFDSKMGIFSINYGLGSEQDNPIVFRSAKVHFGVVNFF